MFIAILTILFVTGTANIPQLFTTSIAPSLQIWLWLAFFASFAVKVPMWPLHTWLPDAHVEAPTAGSVILAGVLLKMGGYGFLRLSLPILPQATTFFTPLVFALSVIAIIYTSVCCVCTAGHEKTHRLLIGCPYGIRHPWHVYPNYTKASKEPCFK